MRFALGIAVFSGMVGVTIFGVFFTPVFYEVIRGRTDRRTAEKAAASPSPHARRRTPKPPESRMKRPGAVGQDPACRPGARCTLTLHAHPRVCAPTTRRTWE
jgi:hypothetical protein